MGHASAEPRKGFDHWVSFRGQGRYNDLTFNVNGEEVQREGYTTDIITEYVLDWLENRESDKPFFLYVGHKAPHHGFEPAPRHKGRYANAEIDYPATMADTEENYAGKPEWLEEQRDSMHGVDYLFRGSTEFDDLYRRYSETLLALDEGIGQVIDYLDTSGLAEETLAMYMGDNGFYLGEHGVIDKRSAYEESMRVPLLAYAPGMIDPGTRVSELTVNTDIAPSTLQAAGRAAPDYMVGRSFLPLLQGQDVPWRNHVFYEYFWEETFPQQPTTFSLRSERYKYIWYYGIWEENEFYDLAEDPREQHNLIDAEVHQPRIQQMQDRLFDVLVATDGMNVPLRRPPNWKGGSERRPADAPKTGPNLSSR
jgi:arylsulfatase A-like enzyme